MPEAAERAEPRVVAEWHPEAGVGRVPPQALLSSLASSSREGQEHLTELAVVWVAVVAVPWERAEPREAAG